MKYILRRYNAKVIEGEVEVKDITDSKKVDKLKNNFVFQLTNNENHFILSIFVYLSGDSYKEAIKDRDNKIKYLDESINELSRKYLASFISEEEILDTKIYINFNSSVITLNKTEFYGHIRNRKK